MLKAGGPGNQRGDYNRNQNIGYFRGYSAQSVHDAEGQCAHGKRGPMGIVPGGLNDAYDRLVMVLGLVHIYPEYFGKLR